MTEPTRTLVFVPVPPQPPVHWAEPSPEFALSAMCKAGAAVGELLRGKFNRVSAHVFYPTPQEMENGIEARRFELSAQAVLGGCLNDLGVTVPIRWAGLQPNSKLVGLPLALFNRQQAEEKMADEGRVVPSSGVVIVAAAQDVRAYMGAMGHPAGDLTRKIVTITAGEKGWTGLAESRTVPQSRLTAYKY